jgi:hypothetical protein
VGDGVGLLRFTEKSVTLVTLAFLLRNSKIRSVTRSVTAGDSGGITGENAKTRNSVLFSTTEQVPLAPGAVAEAPDVGVARVCAPARVTALYVWHHTRMVTYCHSPSDRDSARCDTHIKNTQTLIWVLRVTRAACIILVACDA